MMMRASSGIVCVVASALSFAVACSWGGAASKDGTPDASSTARCGDGVCAASEVNNCPADCGTGSNGSGSGSNTGAVCGNGTCENGETNTSCPSDCTGSGSGSSNCPSDVTVCFACLIDATMCPSGLDATSCLTCIAGGLGSGTGGCDGGTPDGTCQPDETNATCPQDCP